MQDMLINHGLRLKNHFGHGKVLLCFLGCAIPIIFIWESGLLFGFLGLEFLFAWLKLEVELCL
jgi:hypothetical protein